jgi:glycerol uptake facilitator-like aquaporin
VKLRAVVAEFVGTAMLLLAVVGSGIMAERLCGGNVGLALLANALATGGALVALILAFGPVSGAHFNPAITLVDAWQGGVPWRSVAPYVAAQVAGALLGTALADGMFGLPPFFASHHARGGAQFVLSEFVATFGLLATIWGCVRSRPAATPFAVAAYIVGAYWFTPSTSFANPAVTLARSLTDTFTGIRPQDVPAFVAAQLAGAFAATLLFAYLSPISRSLSVVQRDSEHGA